MRHFLRFLISKQFFIHLALALCAFVIVCILALQLLRSYTRQNEDIVCPDLTGLTEEQFQTPLKIKQLRYEIIDSVYKKEAAPGTVTEQFPTAGSKIKPGRKIQIIITPASSQKSIIPDIKNYPLRQAMVSLQNAGLKVGELIYVHSQHKNLVLGTHFNGMEVVAGSTVARESTIDLIVGQGLSEEKTPIPQLLGLTLQEAENKLLTNSLNTGTLVYDTLGMKADDQLWVYKQSPLAERDKLINLGANITLWITCDTTKIPKIDTAIYNMVDSIFMEQHDML